MRRDEAAGERRQVLQLATVETNTLAEVRFDQREIGNFNNGYQLGIAPVLHWPKAPCFPPGSLERKSAYRPTFDYSPCLMGAQNTSLRMAGILSI